MRSSIFSSALKAECKLNPRLPRPHPRLLLLPVPRRPQMKMTAPLLSRSFPWDGVTTFNDSLTIQTSRPNNLILQCVQHELRRTYEMTMMYSITYLVCLVCEPIALSQSILCLPRCVTLRVTDRDSFCFSRHAGILAQLIDDARSRESCEEWAC